jgi:hypothetical protein
VLGESARAAHLNVGVASGKSGRTREPRSCTSPMEYAVELHRLIQLEMEGSVG